MTREGVGPNGVGRRQREETYVFGRRKSLRMSGKARAFAVYILQEAREQNLFTVDSWNLLQKCSNAWWTAKPQIEFWTSWVEIKTIRHFKKIIYLCKRQH